jgi:hypothetical protein
VSAARLPRLAFILDDRPLDGVELRVGGSIRQLPFASRVHPGVRATRRWCSYATCLARGTSVREGRGCPLGGIALLACAFGPIGQRKSSSWKPGGNSPGNRKVHREPTAGQAAAFSWSVKAFQVSAGKANWGRLGACCRGSLRLGRSCRPRRRCRRCRRCSCSCATRRWSRPSFLGHFPDQVAGRDPRLGLCPESIETKSDMTYR